MASLSDAVARPRVYINTDEIPSEDGNNVTFNRTLPLADAIEKPPETTVAPEVKSSIAEPEPSKVQAILDKLFGLHGQERYQLWPEKLARDALSAPHDVMTGLIPQYEVDPVTGEAHTSTAMIKAAQDVSALAGTGGLAGAGGEAGVALGSGPLKQAVMSDIQPKFDFNVGASSGSKTVKLGPTEITYGVNPKNNDVELSLIRTDKNERGKGAGRAAIEQFLNEADANNKRVLLNADPMDKSTSKNKLVDFYKSLGFVRNKGSNKDFTTRSEFIRNPFLKSDNEAGLGINALAQTNKPFYSAVENALTAAKQPKADAQQWLSFLKNQPGIKQEELAHLGLDKLQGPITREDLLKAVQEGQPQIKEVIKGDLKFDNNSKYALPEVIKAAKQAGETPGDLELTLANDGDAYRALMKKFPELKNNEDWAEIVSKNVFGGDSIPTGTSKFSGYQLPGATNYREMLLTLPDKHAQYIKNIDKQFEDVNTELRILSNNGKQNTPEYDQLSKQYNQLYNERKQAYEKTGTAYQSSHWDEPNVLAHIRMNDRMIDGKKSLHLEEVQSDWGQAGRKNGFKGENEELRQQLREKEKTGDLTRAEGEQLSKLERAVPNMPFKKTWDELALKKAITEAVKNGYDQISWTPGEAQAARYDLSKQVDAIRANKNPDGTYQIGLKKPGHNMGRPTKEMESVPADKLADFVGKELAEKIIKDVIKPNEHGKEFIDNGKVYSGLDLKVGGQGMKAFYDKMLVDKMNKLVSKYDSKVKMVDHGSMKIPTVTITPKLKEKVLKEGFPLFSAGVPIFTPIDYDPFENK